MGARLLKRWIVFPLKDIHKINERLDTVEFLIKETDLRNKSAIILNNAAILNGLVSKIPTKENQPAGSVATGKRFKTGGIIKQLMPEHLPMNTSNDWVMH